MFDDLKSAVRSLRSARLGLVIAAVGIYGVMAYVVARRTNEIGVRMALGATPVRAFLFEVDPTSAGVFAAAIGVLAAASLLASAIPARRAARVEPLVALRHE